MKTTTRRVTQAQIDTVVSFLKRVKYEVDKNPKVSIRKICKELSITTLYSPVKTLQTLKILEVKGNTKSSVKKFLIDQIEPHHAREVINQSKKLHKQTNDEYYKRIREEVTQPITTEKIEQKVEVQPVSVREQAVQKMTIDTIQNLTFEKAQVINATLKTDKYTITGNFTIERR